MLLLLLASLLPLTSRSFHPSLRGESPLYLPTDCDCTQETTIANNLFHNQRHLQVENPSNVFCFKLPGEETSRLVDVQWRRFDDVDDDIIIIIIISRPRF